MRNARPTPSVPAARKALFSVALEPPLLASVDSIARDFEVSRSQVIRWAVREYVAKKQREAKRGNLRVVKGS